MAETNFENATLKLLIEDEDGIVTVASLQQTPAIPSGGGSFLANEIARVDPTGDDDTGEVGDLAKPFLTVQGAIDAIEAGSFTYPIIDIGMNQYFGTTVTTSLPQIRFVGSSDEIGTSSFATYYASVCDNLILTDSNSIVELSGCELATVTATADAPATLKIFLENAGITGSEGQAVTAVSAIKIAGNGYVRSRVTDTVTSSSGATITLLNVYIDDIDSAGSNVIADSLCLIRRISHAANLTLKDSRALSKTITGTLAYDDTFLNGVVAVAVPAAANSIGITGQMAGDDNYLYRCTATNTWKRVAIATWP